jgi:2-methylcitrate dehydratase PrpD
MTPEELDEARVREAMRLWGSNIWKPGDVSAVGNIAARLAREGWTPPEPVVDPDILAFREWLMKREPDMRRQSYAYDADFWDNCLSAQAYLAGARMAREQERERAKGLVEYVEAHVRGVNVIFTHSEVLAKYLGEA